MTSFFLPPPLLSKIVFLLPLFMYNAQLNHTQTVRLYYISVNIVVLDYVMIVNKLIQEDLKFSKATEGTAHISDLQQAIATIQCFHLTYVGFIHYLFHLVQH